MAFRTNKVPVLQEKSASGSVATFNTALAMPLSSCKIAVNAWQEGSGDPYPAGGSAQIWDEEWEHGQYTNGVKTDSTARIRSKNLIPVTPSQTYRYVCDTSVFSDWIAVSHYDQGGAYVSNQSVNANRNFTIPEDIYFITFHTSSNWGGVDYSGGLGINYPATDTSYHPYSNVRPIHGFSEVNATRAGKNLFDYDSITIDRITFIVSSGEITRSGFVYRLPKGEYTFSAKGVAQTYVYMNIYGSDGTYKENIRLSAANPVWYTRTFNLAEGDYIIVYQAIESVTLDISSNEFMFEAGSTASAYEPYTGNIYTIQFGQEVYGAEVDVDNGVAHITWILQSMDFRWAYVSSNNGYFSPYTALPNQKAIGLTNIICDIYKTSDSSTTVDMPDLSIKGTSYNKAIILRDNSFGDDATAFREAVKNHYICYELDTPFDIQLTPQQIETLIGNNTIFADTGDVDLTFKDLDIAKRGNFREVFRLPS